MGPTMPPVDSSASASPHTNSASGSDTDADEETERVKQRARERLSRLRRKANLVHMRERVQALETMVTALSVVRDGNSVWDEFLDDSTKSMRLFLRRSLALAMDIRRLASEQATLQRLLDEQKLVHPSLGELLETSDPSTGVGHLDWAVSVARWRETARMYFAPWTSRECLLEMNAAVREMNAAAERGGMHARTSGTSLMGWHGSCHLDAATSSIQLRLRKSFTRSDMLRHSQHIWKAYTHGETYTRVVHGNHAAADLEVLQCVNDDVCIVRYVERCFRDWYNVHVVYLLFRVRTKRGFLIVMRSIDVPGFRQAITTAASAVKDYWSTESVWLQWDSVNAEADLRCTDYVMSVGGSLASGDFAYARRWAFEAQAALLRVEMDVLGHRLLSA